MPIYEYKCPNCGNVSEVWQKSFEESTELCEKCGNKMKKVISQNTFLLKGVGWYVTDYGTKAQKKEVIIWPGLLKTGTISTAKNFR